LKERIASIFSVEGLGIISEKSVSTCKTAQCQTQKTWIWSVPAERTWKLM